ncbi:hypothetical protein IIB79_00440, partial [candidate division KSB1 bacterium]|nr:hypothetical protein [candidate division KSB1 bacterium]
LCANLEYEGNLEVAGEDRGVPPPGEGRFLRDSADSHAQHKGHDDLITASDSRESHDAISLPKDIQGCTGSLFTDKGRCYWLRVHEVPLAGKASKGRAIVNLLEKDKNEKLCTFVSVKHFDPDMNIIMATRKGVIKKTLLSSYSRPRRNGINAINIREDDDLIEAKITDGTQDIVLGTHHGQAIRFKETDVRAMGRTATGVRGVRLRKNDFVVGMVVIKRDATLMVVTEKGFGKRSFVRDYRITRRGGVGIITIKTTERIGKMITIQEVVDEDDLMIITTNGVVIRLKIQGVNVIGRNTQGVRLIRLDEKDNIADVTRVAKSDEEDEESEESEEENFEEETE